MFRIILSLLIAGMMLASCGSLRKGSTKMDESPYADGAKDDGIEVQDEEDPEEDQEEIVVREEKVRSVDIEEEDETIFRYYVIIGSFRFYDNATTYKEDLKEEGFVPVVLENENGLFRISVAAYDEEKPARKNIASIRRNYPQYSDVWLLIRKQ
ncbi:MAG: SPOR domain-containing protein [Marinilabiliaceae bacterium]